MKYQYSEHEPPGAVSQFRALGASRRLVVHTGLILAVVESVVTDVGAQAPAVTQPEETPFTHGRGLGLRLVYAIVGQSGGHLEVVDTEQGTAVRLWLPRAQPPAARTEASTTAPPAGEPGC